jgi:hypothetical protein
MTILDLPDPAEWQPRSSAAETLQTAFLQRCLSAEQVICVRAMAERNMNIDNFDSGLGVEDIVREEFRRILPARYVVDNGVVVDRDGRTAGDCDVVIFNEHWFPKVKSGASASSRRTYFPIEGVYAVGEIKQTLDCLGLDDALRKLITTHRLTRPATFARRLVENRESSSCSHGLSNPLYSFVLALNIAEGTTLEDLINRFYDINKQVKRLEMVRALCVLGRGTVTWGYHDREIGGLTSATFMLEDLYESLVPVYQKVPQTESALFALLGNLMLHLFHSVLAPEDIAAIYGTSTRNIMAPKAPEIVIHPDPEWMSRLRTVCGEDHKVVHPTDFQK